ncbi:4-hydroxy-2-oxovalerate aldolase [Legionella erythra]|uniref:4-hydroxy-2-oxovalerate aldolase n=1 Tax=Legionella erythra TaxID=448 RepID=A0A0W0TQ74_LEGER|nr:4-hydroxy-2-oxovalerate aldolase [Legionella erythra]KTC97740.1 4-hydroxy-2-oxovalerate aldolase [Legionella erythra]
MNPLHVLDVSLRDGGHRTNFHFSSDDLKAILTPLDHSGIEYIEVGYRNGSLHPIPGIGDAGLCPRSYLQLCQNLIQRARIAVMVHPENVARSDFVEMKACGVKLIRICVIRGGIQAACETLDRVKDTGLDVSVNFIHTSQYQESELDNVVAQAASHHPDMIYFADSNGSLMPARVSGIYKRYIPRYPIAFGYHAHDNLGLAQANTLAAIDAGVQYVDASLAGMGKGIGNLKTEFFAAYLHANQLTKYNLDDLLTASNYTRHALGIGQEAIEMDEFIRGIADLSTAQVKQHSVK